MRMARMWNAHFFLFRIPIPEWTEHQSIHSTPRGRMNRMLRMKIQDGGRQDERCGFKYVSTREKIRLHFWTQWNINASNFIVPKVRGFFRWCFVQEKGNLANDCRRHEEKWLLSVGNKLREQVEMPYFFVPEVRRQQQHICYAMFTRARTAHLDGHFFMQAILIILRIPYQPFLFQNCGLKNAP